MQVHYLEIVTKEVDAVCAAYAAAIGVRVGGSDAGLGNARTAPLPGGGLVGVRAPMHTSEEPVVRPYWLVDDIEAALAELPVANGIGQRERVPGSLVFLRRRHDPDIVGDVPGDGFKHLKPGGVNAVVVGDKDAHQGLVILSAPPI
mgnify:CR=1 FL=1